MLSPELPLVVDWGSLVGVGHAVNSAGSDPSNNLAHNKQATDENSKESFGDLNRLPCFYLKYGWVDGKVLVRIACKQSARFNMQSLSSLGSCNNSLSPFYESHSVF